MMIQFVIHSNIAFINTGGNHRFIGYFYYGSRGSLAVKRFLNADAIGRAVFFWSDAQHISPQVNGAFHDTVLVQVFFHPVCNIALGNAPKVDSSFWIFQPHFVIFNHNILIIHGRNSIRKLAGIRKSSLVF